MSTMQKNRLKRMPTSVHKPIKNILKSIQQELKSIDKQLDKTLAKVPEYQAKVDQLTSAKGVGKVLADSMASSRRATAGAGRSLRLDAARHLRLAQMRK